MPGGDRTGPMGLGPMTGRGAGYCAGYGVPGYMNPMPGGRGFGYGFGGGRGRGRGWRHGFYATGLPGWARGGMPVPFVPYAAPYAPYAAPTAESERSFLQAQLGAFQEQMGQIQQRLDELSKESTEREGA